MNHWATKYVIEGKNRTGLNCWSLFQLIYAENFGIFLPEIPDLNISNLHNVCNAIKEERQLCWIEVVQPFDGCGVGMGQTKAIHHVGVYADVDGGKIVHSWEGQGVIADTIRGVKLKGFRSIKFYRHYLWRS